MAPNNYLIQWFKCFFKDIDLFSQMKAGKELSFSCWKQGLKLCVRGKPLAMRISPDGITVKCLWLWRKPQNDRWTFSFLQMVKLSPRDGNCPELERVISTAKTVRTQLSLHNSPYSRGPFLPAKAARAECKPLCSLYLGHNRKDLQKDNLPCFLQNTCGTKNKALISNSFVHPSFT